MVPALPTSIPIQRCHLSIGICQRRHSSRRCSPESTESMPITSIRKRWMRPTGNWSPALELRDLDPELFPFFPRPPLPLPDIVVGWWWWLKCSVSGSVSDLVGAEILFASLPSPHLKEELRSISKSVLLSQSAIYFCRNQELQTLDS